MATPRKRKPQTPPRTLGVSLLSAGAAAIGLGAALVAMLARRRAAAPAAGHSAPDLAPAAPAPTPPAPVALAPAAEERAPDHFRPDPTAVPTAEEREALRPATGPAPSLAADRGSAFADPQDSA